MLASKWTIAPLIIASGLIGSASSVGPSELPPVAAISNPTLHHYNIKSHGATLGVSELGGGYANFLDAGDGKNLIAAAYGRGWQPSIRDAMHGGLYNPTQAGAMDPAGTPVVLKTTRSPYGAGGRIDIPAFPMALFINPGFDFALPPASLGRKRVATVDTDGIDDGSIPFQDQIRSEFDFSGFFQDASALADNALPVFQFDFTMTYARDPGGNSWLPGHPYSPIFQFGPTARTDKGLPVFKPEARDHIGGPNFPARLATDTDLSGGVIGAGIRLVYSAGYHTEMWVDEDGNWKSQSLDEKETMHLDTYRKEGDKVGNSFAILANGDNPKTARAVAIYVPQSSVINAQQIVGIDRKTGQQAYTEDRRVEWNLNSNRHGAAEPGSKAIQTYLVDGVPIEDHMTVLRPVLKFSGILAPGHAMPNVVEAVRCEEFVLLGTPEHIRTAIAAIDKRLRAAGDARK